MKTKTLLLLAFLYCLPNMVSAQNTFYNDTSVLNVCDTSYYFTISPNSPDYTAWSYGNLVIDGNNIINSNFDLTIIWGDGDTTNHTGTAITSGTAITWNNPLSHTYTTGGNYSVTLLLTDLTNSVTYTLVQNIGMGVCWQYASSSGQLDCDNDGTIDSTFLSQQVPLIFVDTAGTNYYGSLIGSNMIYLNMPTGTYQAVVDPVWLAANGYLVSNITPSSITTNFWSGNFTFQVSLICDSTLFTSNCLNGITFCDDNNNGIYDSLELGLGSVPLTLHLPNGSTYNTVSDPNGLYSFSYSGFSSGGYVSIDQNWMATNGYFTSNLFNDSLANLDCVNNPILTIPIICDTNTLSVGCIDGYVYCDDNNNGFFDSTETAYNNAPVILDGLGGLITIYTDSNGYYSYTGWQLQGGSVLVTIDSVWQQNNWAFLFGNGLTFNNLNCANANQANLGLNCNTPTPCADLWSSVTPWNGYFQNFNNSVRLQYGNYGLSAPGNYTVTLDFPSGVTPVQSSINNPNYTIAGNTITWNLTSNNTSMNFTDIIYFSTPTGIPDSTLHIYSSTISSATADCDSSNNYYNLNMLVGLSYDPNDKSVNMPPIVNPFIQDEYTYLVRFQNTGTAPAQDVFILDTLSTNLDWSTFHVLETSHPMQLVDLGNGLVKFDFPQIWLPDSTSNEPLSHGHVIYRIKELASLGEGDVIENTAYIYFDQNPPIITNTTVNTNTQSLGIKAVGLVDFSVFPNPAQSTVSVKAEGNIETIRIIDLSGKLVFESAGNANQENINIESLSTGVYNIEIKTSTGIGRRLFVKQ